MTPADLERLADLEAALLDDPDGVPSPELEALWAALDTGESVPAARYDAFRWLWGPLSPASRAVCGKAMAAAWAEMIEDERSHREAP